MRVYGLGYATMAVTRVTMSTSVTGYWPSLENLRYRHQYMLAFMNIVAMQPCKEIVRLNREFKITVTLDEFNYFIVRNKPNI